MTAARSRPACASNRLPEADEVGISVLANLPGGKLLIWDRATGTVAQADGDSELAQQVKDQGGVVFQ
jgi:hypothetical protein